MLPLWYLRRAWGKGATAKVESRSDLPDLKSSKVDFLTKLSKSRVSDFDVDFRLECLNDFIKAKLSGFVSNHFYFSSG